jgi:hypothetical protein
MPKYNNSVMYYSGNQSYTGNSFNCSNGATFTSGSTYSTSDYDRKPAYQSYSNKGYSGLNDWHGNSQYGFDYRTQVNTVYNAYHLGSK